MDKGRGEMDTEMRHEREERSVLLDWNPTGGLGYQKVEYPLCAEALA